MNSRRYRSVNNRAKRSTIQELSYEAFEPKQMLAADLLNATQGTQLSSLLSDRADIGWAQQGLNQLVEVASESNANGTTTVFQQSWNGLPVFDSWVTVSQDASGTITNVRDQTKQSIEGYAKDSEPVSAETATRIAAESLTKVSLLDSDASAAWFFTGNRARLSWLVDTTLAAADGSVAGEYQTWVDVFDGEIFHQELNGESIERLIDDPFTETGVFPRIVINDAIGASGSRDYAAPFDSVVAISVGCTGTLISANTVISARHCGIQAGNSVVFGDNSNGSGTSSFTVSSVVNPAGGNAGSPLLDGGDVSILTLSSSVPSSVATPMRFIDATDELVGLTAVTVGYGWNGLGSSGHGGTADGWRWGGENIIDVFGSPASNSGSNIISTDFDDGSAGSNTIGGSDSNPLTFEATTAPGDSGGPILVDVGGEWVIAGVLSGGTTNTSVYGDISWWTGTAIYRDAIENAGGTFIGDEAGRVQFDSNSYNPGDTVGVEVRDGNGGSQVTVVVTSDSGDSETLTISEGADGIYEDVIVTGTGGVTQDDGTLQVEIGDEITVTYVDANDGTGSSVEQTDTASIIAVPPPGLIGIDFDSSATAPANWLSNTGASGTFSDLGNEDGAGTTVDLTINGSSTGFAVAIDASTIPQHSNPLANVDGQIYTQAEPIEFVFSDLDPLSEYHVYVMSAEAFFDSIEQTVSIQGDGDLISFEQRFLQGELFVNDQVGDSSRNLEEYAISVTSNADGEITINVDPIAGTEDVVISGLGILPIPSPPVAPVISLNDAEVERSVINELVISFEEVVTVGSNAFELLKRGQGGGLVDVTPVVDNSSGASVVTLSFSGSYVESSGSLSDGNYQLTVFGDEITSSNGVAVDADGDGVAGGNLVFGDTITDQFFRFFGDETGDRSVDVFDLLPMRRTYNSSSSDPDFDAQFDANGDGIVNVFDLLEFRRNYTETLAFV